MGTGRIGLAIARRVAAGGHLVLADYSIENAEREARDFQIAGEGEWS